MGVENRRILTDFPCETHFKNGIAVETRDFIDVSL